MRQFPQALRVCFLGGLIALAACSGNTTPTAPPAPTAAPSSTDVPSSSASLQPPMATALATPSLLSSPAATPRQRGWSTHSPVPTARTECAAAVLDGQIYLSGSLHPRERRMAT